MPRPALLRGAALAWLGLLLIPLAAAWDRSADLAHGWAAPLLMAQLWWERAPRSLPGRGPGPAPRFALTDSFLAWLLLGVAIVGVTARLFLEPFPLWPGALLLHCAVYFVIGGLLAFRVGGPALLRWLVAPGLLLLAALPWPGVIDRAVLQPLREILASLAAELLTLAASPAVAEGTSVRLAGGWVGIDEACGGIRSLQAALLLALFFGEFARFTFSRRTALILLSVGFALGGNLARILFLASVADGGPERIAAVHDTAGWLALGGTLACVAAAAWLLRGQSAPSARPGSLSSPQIETASPHAATVAAPVWLFVAPLALLALGEIGTRAWFASGENQAPDAARWSVRLPLARASYQAEPLSDTAREMLQPDHYEAGRWRDETGERVAAYALEWRRGQLARTLPFLHNPTVCLPLAGCELRASLDPETHHAGGLAIPFRRHLFSRAGEEFLVSYVVWDPTRGQVLRQPADSPDLRSWLAAQCEEIAARRRHQPAQLLCVAVFGTDAEARSRALLSSLVQPAE